MSSALLLCAYGVRLPRFPGTRCNLVVGTPGMLPLPLADVLQSQQRVRRVAPPGSVTVV